MAQEIKVKVFPKYQSSMVLLKQLPKYYIRNNAVLTAIPARIHSNFFSKLLMFLESFVLGLYIS